MKETFLVKEKKQKTDMNRSQKNIALFIQVIIGVLLVLFSIMYLFMNELLPVLEGIAVAFLWLGAYNSTRLYQKKTMTILYIFAGIIVLANLIVGLL